MNSVLQFDLQITRAPAILTTIAATNITAADVAAAGPANSELVLSICSTLPAGGTPVSAANSPTVGAWATTVNAYAGFTVTVYRSNKPYSAVILASDVATYTGSQATATNNAGRQQVLYLSTPLRCGAITTSDIVVISASQTFQRGGASNLIKRLRVMYGSLTLEDIYEYKTLVRILYECGVQRDYAESHGQIGDGMYSTSAFDTAADTSAKPLRSVTTEQSSYVVSFSNKVATDTFPQSTALVSQAQLLANVVTPAHELAKLDMLPLSYINSSGSYVTTPMTLFNYGAKTYCLNLLSGVFTQKKLIPLKW